MEPHILKNRSQAQNSHAKTNQWCSEAKSSALCWRSKVRRVWAPLQPLQASQIFSLNRKVAMSSVTVGASKQNEHVSSKSERVSSILTPWTVPFFLQWCMSANNPGFKSLPHIWLRCSKVAISMFLHAFCHGLWQIHQLPLSTSPPHPQLPGVDKA